MKHKDFIIVKGSGESDLSRHPGSYHYALADANGIHKYNIVNYSSVLSRDSKRLELDSVTFDDYQVELEDGVVPDTIIMPKHGEVINTIMANAEGEFGDTINAGLIYAWLYDDTDNRVGGFVCELTNKGTVAQLEERLRQVIQESFDNTFAKEGLFIGEPEVVIKSLQVTKRFGNAIVAIVFVN